MQGKFSKYTAHRLATEMMYQKGPETPPEVLASLVQFEAIESLAVAVRRIAEGDQYGPCGLEGLAIAVGGRRLDGSVAESLSELSEQLTRAVDLLEQHADKDD